MKTREELQQTIGKLEAELQQLKDADTTRRKEISRVFGRYYEEAIGTSWRDEKRIMSWETILVEIGKYMGRDEYAAMMREKEQLRMTLDEVEK